MKYERMTIQAVKDELSEEVYAMLDSAAERRGKTFFAERTEKDLDRKIEKIFYTNDIIDSAIENWQEENGEHPNIKY